MDQYKPMQMGGIFPYTGACINPSSEWENNHHYFSKVPLLTFIIHYESIVWAGSNPESASSVVPSGGSTRGRLR